RPARGSASPILQRPTPLGGAVAALRTIVERATGADGRPSRVPGARKPIGRARCHCSPPETIVEALTPSSESQGLPCCLHAGTGTSVGFAEGEQPSASRASRRHRSRLSRYLRP